MMEKDAEKEKALLRQWIQEEVIWKEDLVSELCNELGLRGKQDSITERCIRPYYYWQQDKAKLDAIRARTAANDPFNLKKDG